MTRRMTAADKVRQDLALGRRLSTPLHRLTAETRRSLLTPFVGRRVRIAVDTLRHGDRDAFRYYEGKLVAIATPISGTVSDQAVINPGHGLKNGATAWTVSLATIVDIEDATIVNLEEA